MTTNSSTSTAGSKSAESSSKRGYNIFLLVIAGLGGLLYGMDYGIVASALPYLKDTFAGTPAELSIIVAAMMLGGVFSTLFAGLLADWMGRKRLMNFCGGVFVAAIPLIALSHGYAPLFFGRLLEGISAGLIGVVIPLYLAECLAASSGARAQRSFSGCRSPRCSSRPSAAFTSVITCWR